MIETIKKIIRALNKTEEDNMTELYESDLHPTCPKCGSRLIEVRTDGTMACPKLGCQKRPIDKGDMYL